LRPEGFPIDARLRLFWILLVPRGTSNDGMQTKVEGGSKLKGPVSARF
jgi:hypothetical protein